MGRTRQTRSVVPKVVLNFLQNTLPFNELDIHTLKRLARNCLLDYYPKGTLIFRQDATDVTHLHIIQRGEVKVYLDSSDSEVTLDDYGGKGDSFGALSIVKKEKADSNVETVEDTFCLLIDKIIFLEVIDSNPRFAGHYLESLSENTLGAVYTELRCEKARVRGKQAFSLFETRIIDVLNKPPDVIEGSMTIQEVGARMSDLGLASLLVTDQSGEIAGIVTNKDFRTKVVAEAIPHETPVAEIMSSPIRTIPAQALCFDALIRMIREQVDHLVVENRGEITGMVASYQIMSYQGASPLYLFSEISAQRDIPGLYAISQRLPVLVRTLIEEGARAGNITKMITAFSDHALKRLLRLLLDEMGPAPVPFCWLMLGSEGRREQTFRTDQDNALVYQDPADEKEREAASVFFHKFAASAVEHLEACGYPQCKENLMVTNPMWRVPYSIWLDYFDKWIGKPVSEEVTVHTFFLDFRPGYGNTSLGKGMKDRLVDWAKASQTYQEYLARDCLLNWPPLSFFGKFVVEKDGRQTIRLDLKNRALAPFVNFARLMAMRNGIRETNTLDRLQRLAEHGHISQGLFADLREAYEFNFQLNLVNQLRMVEAGQEPHNVLDPAELTDLERRSLKESFGVIDRMLAHLRKEFKGVA
jgi:CBS domain-containing protein